MKGRISVLMMVLAFAMLTVAAFAQDKAPTTPPKPATPPLAAPAKAMVPTIEGTYKFISRKLPDGKTVSPPDAQGLQTFTRGYRNFNVMWKDSTGKHFSYSVASTYKLTDKDYTETLLYSAMNDEIGIMPGSKPGSGVQYAVGDSKTVPVKLDGAKVEFKLPFDPPSCVFDGNHLTATLEGGFVDTWERVR